jgi:hypothetical protein
MDNKFFEQEYVKTDDGGIEETDNSKALQYAQLNFIEVFCTMCEANTYLTALEKAKVKRWKTTKGFMNMLQWEELLKLGFSSQRYLRNELTDWDRRKYNLTIEEEK